MFAWMVWTTPVAVFFVVIALMLIVGRRVLPWALWQVAKTGSRELFTLAVIAAAIGITLGPQGIAGRVARAAMAQAVHQLGAPVPGRIAVRARRHRPRAPSYAPARLKAPKRWDGKKRTAAYRLPKFARVWKKYSLPHPAQNRTTNYRFAVRLSDLRNKTRFTGQL